MCGRFTLSTPTNALADLFDVAETFQLPPRYNVAPTNPVAVVRRPDEDAERELALLQWGFIPSWAKEPSVGSRMINARGETAATSPAFRAAFRRRRCLVLSDGFYEWQKLERRKQPFYFRMQDGAPFAFAGLWEHWEGADGSVVQSCTLITGEPNELVRPVHDRMPVILPREHYDLWLDPTVQRVDLLQPLLRPYDADQMVAYPVGRFVNNPANDDPDCIRPLAA